MLNKKNTNISPNPFNGDSKWNQWFAGLTDGDGCFYMDKKEKNVSFELTVHTTDARVIYDIKNKLKAGSVKLRIGSHSIRYRVKKKEVIFEIVKRLNGQLRNPARMCQFKEVCELYNIEYIIPSPLLSKDDGYLSGLIDSDGSFAISVSHSSPQNSQISGVEGRIVRLINSRGYCQISLKVTSSYKNYLEMIQNSYGYGSIYQEKKNSNPKNPNHKYHWTIKSYDDFQILYEYMKKNPFKSIKMHRMRLALLYFRYKNLKYHLEAEGTVGAKIWSKFAKSWYKYSY